VAWAVLLLLSGSGGLPWRLSSRVYGLPGFPEAVMAACSSVKAVISGFLFLSGLPRSLLLSGSVSGRSGLSVLRLPAGRLLPVAGFGLGRAGFSFKGSGSCLGGCLRDPGRSGRGGCAQGSRRFWSCLLRIPSSILFVLYPAGQLCRGSRAGLRVSPWAVVAAAKAANPFLKVAHFGRNSLVFCALLWYKNYR